MKDHNYTEVICKRFCKYYREGKEELTCGTYNFLNNTLTLNELISESSNILSVPDFSVDEEILKTVCEKCDFFKDGCDFRAGESVSPCGGYTIIEWLIRQGLPP